MSNQTLEPKPLERRDQLAGPEMQRVGQLREEFERRLLARGHSLEGDEPVPAKDLVDTILEMLVRRRAL